MRSLNIMVTPANESTFGQYLSFFFGQQFSLLGSSIAQFAIVWWINLGTANLFLGSALLGILVLVPSWFLTDIRHVEDMQAKIDSHN